MTTEIIEKELNFKDEGLQGKENLFDERNYLNTRLAHGEVERDVKIRIITKDKNSNVPFNNVKFHTIQVPREVSKSGFKSFVCLKNDTLPEDKRGNCPLCEKSYNLIKEAKEKDDTELMKKGISFISKMSYIVRCIDRDRLSDGVKFYKFNYNSKKEGIYDKIISIYNIRKNESIEAGLEPYSIFSLENGKDLTLKLSDSVDSSGKHKTSINITDSGFQTKLSNNPEEAEKWLKDPKMWYDVYPAKTYDYLSIIADGKIPYFDNNTKKYVAKDELVVKTNEFNTQLEPDGELPF